MSAPNSGRELRKSKTARRTPGRNRPSVPASSLGIAGFAKGEPLARCPACRLNFVTGGVCEPCAKAAASRRAPPQDLGRLFGIELA